MALWSFTPLSTILTERIEIPESEKLTTGEIPIVSKISFSTGQIELRRDGSTNTKMILIRPGDLLLSGINAYKGGIAIYSGPGPIAATIHYSAYTPIPGRVDVKYLWWLLRSRTFQKLLEIYVPGGIKTELKAERFLPIPIPLPPLDEQYSIVAWIESLVTRIAEARGLRQQTVEEVEALLNSEITEVFHDFQIDTTLSSILVENPRNGWSPVCNNLEDGTPVLTLSAVTGFQYKPWEFKRTSEPTSPSAHYWLQKGDFLITRSNSPGLVGHVAIYNGFPNPCIYSDLIMRFRIDENKCMSSFLLYWLRSRMVRDYIRQNSKGTSPTMKKISQGVVTNIPYSSQIRESNQRRIVTYLDNLHARVDALKRLQTETATELDALLPAVLDRAFRGEFT